MRTLSLRQNGERIAVGALEAVDALQLPPVRHAAILAIVRDVVDAHRDRIVTTFDLDDEGGDE